jgi:hypothetical protein
MSAELQQALDAAGGLDIPQGTFSIFQMHNKNEISSIFESIRMKREKKKKKKKKKISSRHSTQPITHQKSPHCQPMKSHLERMQTIH